MDRTVAATVRPLGAALRILLVLTAVTGIAYPLAVTGAGQAAFPAQANGSVVRAGGAEAGSRLVGQSWNLPGTGRPDPGWFQGRPSESSYDALDTGSGQLGTSDARLVRQVDRARHRVAAFNGVPESAVPADAVTGSASAVDPDISPGYAGIQIRRVARHHGLPLARVERLVAEHTRGRAAGFLGEPRVNVLELNLALRASAADR